MSRLEIQRVALGPLMTNCYLVRPAGAKACWVVDPGLDPGPLRQRLADNALTPERIVLTHGHGDHIAGVAELKQTYPQAVLTVPAKDAEMLADPQLNLSMLFGASITAPAPEATVAPGDTLALGESQWRVLDTSGHTPGGVSYYCPDEAVVIVGDALFAGSVGRCDIPGADMNRQIANIRENLLTLPDETRVLSGHGGETTIGAEKRSNPMLM